MTPFASKFGTIEATETTKLVGFNPDGTKIIEATTKIDANQINDLMLKNAGATGRIHVQNNSVVYFIEGTQTDEETGEVKKMQVSARFRFGTAQEAKQTWLDSQQGEIDMLKAYKIGNPNCTLEPDRFRAV